MKKTIKITIIAAIVAVVIAIASFTATSIYQNSPSYRLTLAERYLSEMNCEQAIIEFEKLVEIDPQNVDYWFKLAEAYEKNGQLEKAKETLERALTYIDDERIKARLAEIELLINPPVTTAAVTTIAPPTTESVITESEPVYAELIVNDIEEGNIYSRGNGVLVSYKEADELYAFASDDGKLLTDYDFTKINYFSGEGEKSCGYVEKVNGEKLIVNSDFETIADVTNATKWFIFNNDEPLVAVFLPGTISEYTVVNNRMDWDNVESEYAGFKIIKYDGSILYEYTDGNGLGGAGTVPSVNEAEMPKEITPIYKCTCDQHAALQNMGVQFKLKVLDLNIGSYIFAPQVCNDRLLISFDMGAEYQDVSDYPNEWEAYKKKKKEDWIAEHPNDTVYIDTENTHDQSIYTTVWYEVKYSDGKAMLVKSEYPAPSVQVNDDYSVHLQGRQATFKVDVYMLKNGNTYHSVIDYSTWDTERTYGFTDISTAVYKDFAVCYKQNAAGNNVAALFKPAWYNTSTIDWETINDKAQSEWAQLTGWYDNIGVINAENGMFWVRESNAEEADENNYITIYRYDTEKGEFIRVSDYFNNLSWDNDMPNVIVCRKAEPNNNPEDSDNNPIITRALYKYDNAKNEYVRVSDWYSSLLLVDSKYMLVSKDDKWGYIDIDGNEYGLYDDASSFSNGYAIITVDNEGWLINEDFEQMSEKFPCESSHVISDGMFAIKYKENNKILSLAE